MAFGWDVEVDGKRVTLRYAKGSGNPVNRPYMLFVRNDRGEPVARMWLGRSHLALLLNQLQQEFKLRPITDILGGINDGTQTRTDR